MFTESTEHLPYKFTPITPEDINGLFYGPKSPIHKLTVGASFVLENRYVDEQLTRYEIIMRRKVDPETNFEEFTTETYRLTNTKDGLEIKRTS